MARLKVTSVKTTPSTECTLGGIPIGSVFYGSLARDEAPTLLLRVQNGIVDLRSFALSLLCGSGTDIYNYQPTSRAELFID